MGVWAESQVYFRDKKSMLLDEINRNIRFGPGGSESPAPKLLRVFLDGEFSRLLPSTRVWPATFATETMCMVGRAVKACAIAGQEGPLDQLMV